jgi:hypothetical protein
MRVRFADRLTDDGTVRCTGCSHEVVVRRGDAVPRCYCGGHEFLFHAARRDDRSPPRRDPDVSRGEGPGAEPGSARR